MGDAGREMSGLRWGLAVFAICFHDLEGMNHSERRSYLWIRPAIEAAPLPNHTNHTNILRENNPFLRPLDSDQRPHTRHQRRPQARVLQRLLAKNHRQIVTFAKIQTFPAGTAHFDVPADVERLAVQVARDDSLRRWRWGFIDEEAGQRDEEAFRCDGCWNLVGYAEVGAIHAGCRCPAEVLIGQFLSGEEYDRCG